MKLANIRSSRLKNFRHGFFTRNGGVSKGIYKGLNCGLGSSDDQKTVLKNRDLVAKNMGTSVAMIERFYGQTRTKEQAQALVKNAPRPSATKDNQSKSYPF